MSIKILIVDDEPIICQGLRLTIPWETYGIEVVGEAFDGKQALEYLFQHPIDIVLTDVRMPEMDGIQLAKAIYEQAPQTRVIVISGYEEFEYAREAFRWGVKDYLLKPVDIDELLKILQKLKVDIALEHESDQKQHHDQIQQYFTQLILSKQPVNDVVLEEHTFCVIGSELENYATLIERYSQWELEQIRLQWKNMFSSLFSNSHHKIFSFFTHPNLLLTFCYTEQEAYTLENDIDFLLKKVKEDWNGIAPLTFGVSNIFQDFSTAKIAFEQVLEGLEHKETLNSPIFINKLEKQQRKSYTKINELILVEALFRQDMNELKIHVDQLFESLSSKQYHFSAIVEVCCELYKTIERRIREVLGESPLIDSNFHISKPIDLHTYNSNEWLKRLFLEDLEKCLTLITNENMGKKSWVVEKAKVYILSHFHRDLKASEVANEIHITPNYFSMIFKKEFGQSFNEYLNELRIEKAKRLLTETSDRIFEIAEEVGYKEYKYFVQVFRKNTGMSPTVYREYKATKEN
ncbi:response regulator transcription factor [Metabacillus dongyingensis]|uniref:response regulator transcription factor n=1 Tax=Metabacillus dongyingensis TaxID=2874282 RepID=UPI003B8E87F4